MAARGHPRVPHSDRGWCPATEVSQPVAKRSLRKIGPWTSPAGTSLAVLRARPRPHPRIGPWGGAPRPDFHYLRFLAPGLFLAQHGRGLRALNATCAVAIIGSGACPWDLKRAALSMAPFWCMAGRKTRCFQKAATLVWARTGCFRAALAARNPPELSFLCPRRGKGSQTQEHTTAKIR